MSEITNRCTGRRAASVALLAIMSTFVGKKRASCLARVSLDVMRQYRAMPSDARRD